MICHKKVRNIAARFRAIVHLALYGSIACCSSEESAISKANSMSPSSSLKFVLVESALAVCCEGNDRQKHHST